MYILNGVGFPLFHTSPCCIVELGKCSAVLGEGTAAFGLSSGPCPHGERLLLSISINNLYEVGPRFFSCSTSTSSMPASFLLLSAAIPFLYSFS